MNGSGFITALVTVAVLVPVICVAAGPALIGLARQRRDVRDQVKSVELRELAGHDMRKERRLLHRRWGSDAKRSAA